jgi:ribosomal protein S27E
MPTKFEIIEDILKVQQKVSRIPKRNDYNKHGSFCHQAVSKCFGNWTNAMKTLFGRSFRQKAMIEVKCDICGKIFQIEKSRARKRPRFYCSEEHAKQSRYKTPPPRNDIPLTNLIEDVKNVFGIVGEIPTRRVYDKLGKYSNAPIKKHFEGWHNAMKAIFGKTRTQKPLKIKSVKCELCGKIFQKRTNQLKLHPVSFCCKSHASKYNADRREGGFCRSQWEIMLCDLLKKEFPCLDIIECDRTIFEGREADIYIPSIKLAIEWNGIFHFKPIFGKDKLAQTQVKDQEKIKIAQDKGVNLIVIPDLVNKKTYVEKCFAKIAKIIRNLQEQNSTY